LFTAGSEFILIFGWANLSPLVGPVFGPMLTGIWQGLGDWYRERTKAVASGVGPLMGTEYPGHSSRYSRSTDHDEPPTEYAGASLFGNKR
jgi:hypothetical protein